jgi:hypothetical protein
MSEPSTPSGKPAKEVEDANWSSKVAHAPPPLAQAQTTPPVQQNMDKEEEIDEEDYNVYNPQRMEGYEPSMQVTHKNFSAHSLPTDSNHTIIIARSAPLILVW